MTRLNSNQWLSLILALVAAAYLAMAWQIPSFPLPRPVDSDLFPKILGLSLLLLSIFLFFEKTATETVEDDEVESGPTTGLFSPWGKVIVTAVAVAAYALLLVPLGFVLTSMLLGVGLTTFYGYRRYTVSFVTCLGVVLALYLSMTRLMDVYLPMGVLPF